MSNICYREDRHKPFDKAELTRRFQLAKKEFGNAWSTEYLERLETDGVRTSSGAFVQICADVLQEYQSQIEIFLFKVESGSYPGGM